jgi:protein-disulfide isomerase
MDRTKVAFVMALALALLGFGHRALADDVPADPRMAERAIGNPKAPIRMDEYFSLDCPHCARFDADVLPEVKKNYIDTGKVYLVFHDFPLHEMALRAHMIARCAPPDRYLPIVETLFKVQQGWNLQTPEASMDALKQQARFAGMSEDKISACVNDRGLEDALLKAQLDATKAYGLNATPSFIFNQKADDKLVAEGPYDKFKEKLDSLLGSK